MKIQTYRVYYKFENDDVEYSALVDERSEEGAKAAIMSSEPITITRVEVVENNFKIGC